MSILLASGSPQRSAILEQLGIPFRVLVPDVEELEMGDPSQLAVENARRKADAALDQARSGDELVLACDTVVDVDGIPFGKPETAEDAFTMLALLRGCSHDVVGGIVLVDPATGDRFERAVRTKVRFRDFPDALLQRYLDGEEWRGRAGGYAIQGTGAAMVSGVGGCYQNVVGLPVAMLLMTLEDVDGWDELARRAA
ncbi:MAG: septum formation protein Maf [Thermoleophilia bacterium]|nr:septum formation protein Maf [Thermoleophilia bacterium]